MCINITQDNGVCVIEKMVEIKAVVWAAAQGWWNVNIMDNKFVDLYG